jgi:hypothetical protein
VGGRETECERGHADTCATKYVTAADMDSAVPTSCRSSGLNTANMPWSCCLACRCGGDCARPGNTAAPALSRTIEQRGRLTCAPKSHAQQLTETGTHVGVGEDEEEFG